LLDGYGSPAPGMVACPTAPQPDGGDTNAATGFSGAKSATNHAARTAIDAWNICRYVDNTGSEDFFIPFNSSNEWISFLNSPFANSAAVNLEHCGRPVHGGAPFIFGPTDKAASDTGDPATWDSPNLPYWRTGKTWPTSALTHTFNYTCHYQKSVTSPSCRRWVSQSCSYTSCDAKGKKCSTYHYDCSYCAHQGTICVATSTSWSETWDFLATALDSDTSNPSWTSASNNVGGTTRPAICNTRCTDNGLDCSCGTTPTVTCSGATCGSDGKLRDSCGNIIGNCNAGVCGSANGTTTDTKPSGAALCSKGRASPVSGAGPWNWTCKGTNGGTTVSCSANLQSDCCPYWGCQ